MKTLVYYKLNSYPFPFVIAAIFHDGMQPHFHIEQEMGEILYEHPFSEDGKVNIVEADAACLKENNLKKMTNDIVCYIEDTV